MRTLKRHLLFLKKTIELSYWRDNISSRTVSPTYICCLHSQVIFLTFEEILRHIKIWFAVRRLIAILSLAWPPRDPKSSFRLLLKQLFYCETRSCQRSICGKSKSSNIWLRSSLRRSKDMNKNAISTRRSLAKVIQTSYCDFIALVWLKM